jgi:hypothetical protein
VIRILHSFTNERVEDQVETILAVDKLMDKYGDVTSCLVSNPDGYWKFLLDHWNRTPFINIEQDIVPTVQSLDSLLSCPEDLCTVPYRLSNGKWSIWYPIYGTYCDFSEMVHYEEPFPWGVVASGLGLVKIGPVAQSLVNLNDYKHPNFDNHRWDFIDTWLSLQLDRVGHKWHVHTLPVKHNHY